MANLDLWEKVRAVPSTAIKPINGGRLKGMSEINPVWRQKELTEQFGMCGIGWKYVITKQWLESGGNNEISAFVNIDLFIKVDGQWSEAIPGTGGSAFVANERNGLYTSDECFKMALTDAISVSCKALGFGADVYWDKDSTKYNKQQPAKLTETPKGQSSTPAKPEASKKDQQNTTASKSPVQGEHFLSTFWRQTRDLGYKQGEVFNFAKQKDVPNLSSCTEEQIKVLYQQLVDLKLHLDKQGA